VVFKSYFLNLSIQGFSIFKLKLKQTGANTTLNLIAAFVRIAMFTARSSGGAARQ